MYPRSVKQDTAPDHAHIKWSYRKRERRRKKGEMVNFQMVRGLLGKVEPGCSSYYTRRAVLVGGAVKVHAQVIFACCSRLSNDCSSSYNNNMPVTFMRGYRVEQRRVVKPRLLHHNSMNPTWLVSYLFLLHSSSAEIRQHTTHRTTLPH